MYAHLCMYAWYIGVHASFTYDTCIREPMHKHEPTGLRQSGPQTGSKIPSLGLGNNSQIQWKFGDSQDRHVTLRFSSMFGNRHWVYTCIAWMKNRCLQQFCTMIRAGGKALVLVRQGLEKLARQHVNYRVAMHHPLDFAKQFPFPSRGSNKYNKCWWFKVFDFPSPRVETQIVTNHSRQIHTQRRRRVIKVDP